MRTRIVIGLLLVLTLAVLLWLDLTLPGFFLCIAAMAVTAAALHELFAMVAKVGLQPFRLTGIGFGIALLPYYMWSEVLEGLLGPRALAAFIIAPLLALILALMARAYTRPEGFGPQLKNIAVTLFGVLYIAVPMAFLVLTRFLTEQQRGKEGWDLVMLVLAVTKASDVGAYFTGSLIGRHKLAPRVSPNKTVEGSAGGIGASTLVAVIMVHSLNIGTLLNLDHALFATISFGIIIGVASQVGDLTESFIKRSAGAKDSGNLLPSFGGVLDLIDSFLVAAPVAYFVLAIFAKVTAQAGVQ
ncbi:MAG: phosphatidate cytidylyltransferase [Planctomycetota bacterium]